LTDFLGSASLLVVSAAIFGPLAGWYAGRRDRQPAVWLVLGTLLGPIALLLLRLAPPGRCPACDTPIAGWPGACPVCGTPFGGLGAPSGVDRAAPLADRAAATSGGIDPTGATDPAALGPASVPRAAEPIPLPVGRAPRRPRSLQPAREWRDASTGGRVGAGRAEPHEIDAGNVLATGVYFGGTASLVVGSRYVIVRHDDRLRLLGPVDRDPSAVALERPLASLTATAIGDRLVITEGHGDRLAIALGSLAGANGPQLEVALSSPPDEPIDVRPASR
jgi:hypothetical protein